MKCNSVQSIQKKTGQSFETRFTLLIPYDMHKHQDRFDENDDEIRGLLEEKHHQDDTSSVSKKAAYNNICKSRADSMQDSWLSKKSKEIKSFADRNDMKKFHEALKTVYGPKSCGTTPFLVQMEAHFRQNTSAVCLMAHQLSMIHAMPSTDCHRWI